MANFCFKIQVDFRNGYSSRENNLMIQSGPFEKRIVSNGKMHAVFQD